MEAKKISLEVFLQMCLEIYKAICERILEVNVTENKGSTLSHNSWISSIVDSGVIFSDPRIPGKIKNKIIMFLQDESSLGKNIPVKLAEIGKQHIDLTITRAQVVVDATHIELDGDVEFSLEEKKEEEGEEETQ